MKYRPKSPFKVLPPADRKPSQVTDDYWLFAVQKTGTYPEPTENSGKWLIFVPVSEVDELWAKIKDATEEGLLGIAAKVSTQKPNPLARNPDTKVICVYTYDWTDEDDVRQVREGLRQLGVIAKIPYKADEDTYAGRYAAQGNKRISKYYE